MPPVKSEGQTSLIRRSEILKKPSKSGLTPSPDGQKVANRITTVP
ncbi:hypothetical protein [Cysteiniphilum marinum]|nr:hypothetical protein [Cysteiniphilum marinum]